MRGEKTALCLCLMLIMVFTWAGTAPAGDVEPVGTDAPGASSADGTGVVLSRATAPVVDLLTGPRVKRYASPKGESWVKIFRHRGAIVHLDGASYSGVWILNHSTGEMRVVRADSPDEVNLQVFQADGLDGYLLGRARKDTGGWTFMCADSGCPGSWDRVTVSSR